MTNMLSITEHPPFVPSTKYIVVVPGLTCMSDCFDVNPEIFSVQRYVIAPDGFRIAVSPGQIEILLPASTIGSGALVAFTRGITFDATSSNLYDPQNSLRFNYNGTDSVQRRVSIPDPGAAKGLLVAHTGRVATTANGLLNSSYATTNGQYTDLPQVLYNTTLSDGTVIDCGTY